MSEFKMAVLTKEAWAVIEAAEAYCDQLCSFNNINHPEVHRRRLELADAVSKRQSIAASKQTPIGVEEAS